MGNYLRSCSTYLNSHYVERLGSSFLFHIASILDFALQNTKKVDEAKCNKLYSDLVALIYKVRGITHEAFYHCIKALCTLCSKQTDGATTLFKFAVSIFKRMNDNVAQVPRILTSICIMARYFDFSKAKDTVDTVKPASFIKDIFNQCIHFAKCSEPKLQESALYGLCSLIIREPRLLVMQSCMNILKLALQSPHEPVKRQTLLLFKEYIIAQEEKLEKAKESGSEIDSRYIIIILLLIFISSNLNAVSNFVEDILLAIISCNFDVRAAGLSVLELVIRHNIYFAQLQMPVITALEADINPEIREHAHLVNSYLYQHQALVFRQNITEGIVHAFDKLKTIQQTGKSISICL
jgi:hypothetical protein